MLFEGFWNANLAFFRVNQAFILGKHKSYMGLKPMTKKNKAVSPYANPVPIWKFWAKHPNDAHKRKDAFLTSLFKRKKKDPLGVTKRWK